MQSVFPLQEPGWPFEIPDFLLDAGDYHLLDGSPAIDAGNPGSAPQHDLDGNVRPCGAGVDMGAYESCGTGKPLFFVRGDATADGTVNITDPILVLNHLFLSGVPPACVKSADSNDDGRLDVSDAVFSLNYLFLGGKALGNPFPNCGADRTSDALKCDSFGLCR